MDPIWRDLFRSLKPNNEGKLSGEQVRSSFSKSIFTATLLGQIWDLSDRDRDGQLSEPEFMTFMYFSDALEKRTIVSIPDTLPSSWWSKLEHALASDRDVISSKQRQNTTLGPNETALLEKQLFEHEQELQDLEKKISVIKDQIRSKNSINDPIMDGLTSYQATIKNEMLKAQQQAITLRKYQEELDRFE